MEIMCVLWTYFNATEPFYRRTCVCVCAAVRPSPRPRDSGFLWAFHARHIWANQSLFWCRKSQWMYINMWDDVLCRSGRVLWVSGLYRLQVGFCQRPKCTDEGGGGVSVRCYGRHRALTAFKNQKSAFWILLQPSDGRSFTLLCFHILCFLFLCFALSDCTGTIFFLPLFKWIFFLLHCI